MFKFFSFISLLTAGFIFVGIAKGDDSYSDSSVKSVYLLRIVSFVEWDGLDEPYRYCIVGDDFLGNTLTFMLRQEAKQERFKVHKKTRLSKFQDCDIVFFGLEAEGYYEEILFSLNGQNILTVSDVENFIQNGGMIGFLNKDQRVTFEVNTKEARDRGITIQSRFLQLADRVIDD